MQSSNNLQHDKLLNGKVILVTGASRGIGKAVAKLLAQHGATCILLARTIAHLEKVYDEIINLNGPTPAIYPLNLISATPNDYKELSKNIESNFGKLDGLINIAGQIGSLTPLEHYPIDQWYKLMQVNLNSTFMLTQTLIPLLKLSNNAKVVFTVNKQAIESKAFWGAYSITNSSLESFANIIADEFSSNKNISFHKVYPENIKTSLYTSVNPGADPKELNSPELAAEQYLEALCY